MNPPVQRVAILVNGQPTELDGPATLMAAMAGLGLSAKSGIAAAVNGEVVPRGAWEARMLGDKDRVVVIRATQGG